MKPKLVIILLLIAIAAGGVLYFVGRQRQPGNHIPAEALKALENDSNLILYSIEPRRNLSRAPGNPNPPPEIPPDFYGRQILGEVTHLSAESRLVIVDTVLQGIRDWNGDKPSCFEPRHGIRVTDASGTYDFLICFECDRVQVISPGEKWTSVGISASGKRLNEILSIEKVPLPTH